MAGLRSPPCGDAIVASSVRGGIDRNNVLSVSYGQVMGVSLGVYRTCVRLVILRLANGSDYSKY